MNAENLYLLILLSSLRSLCLCGEQVCFVRVHLRGDIRG